MLSILTLNKLFVSTQLLGWGFYVHIGFKLHLV